MSWLPRSFMGATNSVMLRRRRSIQNTRKPTTSTSSMRKRSCRLRSSNASTRPRVPVPANLVWKCIGLAWFASAFDVASAVGTLLAGYRLRVRGMPTSFHQELRHRGESLVAYPGADLWKAVGGSDGVAALIEDLYRRIERDELLRVVFPHFNSAAATPFFTQWFGGGRGYSDDLAGGLLPRHQHRYISAKAAAAWLRCMRQALVSRGL